MKKITFKGICFAKQVLLEYGNEVLRSWSHKNGFKEDNQDQCMADDILADVSHHMELAKRKRMRIFKPRKKNKL